MLKGINKRQWSFVFLQLSLLAGFYLPCGFCENSEKFSEMKRMEMVENQLKRRGIRDARVLEAMSQIPREIFVPPAVSEEAYSDNAVPIGYDQTISQPYIVAFMTEHLKLSSQDKVLEIGTGSGYQTAVLSLLARHVYSVEIVPALYTEAKRHLQELGVKNVHFKLGDGWQGWREHAPFDKIIVTAAPPIVPEALVHQLKDGGKMVIPVGEEGGVQNLRIGVKRGEVLETVDTIAVRFVPLVKSEK